MSGCDWGGGGGIRSLGGRTREVPCHSHGQRVRVPPASGASAHGLMGSTSVAGRPLAGRLSVCSAAGSDWLCDLRGVGGLACLMLCARRVCWWGGPPHPARYRCRTQTSHTTQSIRSYIRTATTQSARFTVARCAGELRL